MLPGKPVIRRAVTWLISHQNPDGGWGEDLRSYDDPAWAGRGDSTASQTAWALLALLAAGGPTTPCRSAERGVAVAGRDPAPDGTWDEPQFTGTGFPGDFYINYHLYRLVFPVSALGRYLAGAAVTRLTVCAPLAIEALAVRRGLRGAAAAGRGARCVRAGYGPARAAAHGGAPAARPAAPEVLAVGGRRRARPPAPGTGDLVVAHRGVRPERRP